MKIDGYIDSHTHLAKVLSTHPERLDQWLLDAQNAGIGFFMHGGIDPDDWDRQLVLKSRLPESIGLCFGVHPYFAGSKTINELDLVLDVLARRLAVQQKQPGLLAVGELGLDFRPQYTEKGTDSQFHALEVQMELADLMNLPMVFHIVQAHPECEKVFSAWSPKNKRGLMHSFSGSLEHIVCPRVSCVARVPPLGIARTHDFRRGMAPDFGEIANTRVFQALDQGFDRLKAEPGVDDECRARRGIGQQIKDRRIAGATQSAVELPTLIDLHPCAHWRNPMVVMRCGCLTRLFQARQQ